jgi:DNA-binding NtrC family response regulator
MVQRPPIIMITAHGDIQMAVDAMKNGAHDFVQKPVQFASLEKSIQRAEELVAMRRQLALIQSAQQQKVDFIIGSSPEMQKVVETALRAAARCVPVLITGENGTGKEVLAKFIHQNGPRASKMMVSINCAAIQSTMLESEMFGYEPGAFTNATKRKNGLMEVADEGILFLDEIASMPLDIQPKVLRAVEDKRIRRLGGTAEVPIDIQIVAASNRNLPQMIEKGEFRSDLYYRLKVIDLHLPPLRERKDSIPELVGLFIRKINMERGYNIKDATPRAIQALMAYDYPGNIRELQHAIEHAMLMCDDIAIDIQHLPNDITRPRG